MKKLIRFNSRKDYGTDFYIQFLNLKKWSLFQISLSWNDYPSSPYFQFTLGSNGLLTTLFWVYKFGLDIDFVSRTWNWDYIRDYDAQQK
jgi:hypothetical protein